MGWFFRQPKGKNTDISLVNRGGAWRVQTGMMGDTFRQRRKCPHELAENTYQISRNEVHFRVARFSAILHRSLSALSN